MDELLFHYFNVNRKLIATMQKEYYSTATHNFEKTSGIIIIIIPFALISIVIL